MAQPVEQAPLISGGPLIIAGDGAQLGVQQPLHEQSVAGLDHHPDLGRIRFQGRDLGEELVDGCRAVLHPQDLYHPWSGCPRATR
jgi:hypothetical protein